MFNQTVNFRFSHCFWNRAEKAALGAKVGLGVYFREMIHALRENRYNLGDSKVVCDIEANP